MKTFWHRLMTVPTYRVLQAGILVVIAVSFTTSFKSGSAGAGLVGFDSSFLFALPLVLDVVAAMATVIHGRVRNDKEMRGLAAKFVLVPMLLSWGSNGIDHFQRAGHTADGWGHLAQGGWYAAVILGAGICPVAVAALLHLMAKYVEYEQRQAELARKEAEAAKREAEEAAHEEAESPKPRRKPVAATPAKLSAPVRSGGKPLTAKELDARRKWEAARKADQRARKAKEQAGQQVVGGQS
jgi:hypothetical protein